MRRPPIGSAGPEPHLPGAQYEADKAPFLTLRIVITGASRVDWGLNDKLLVDRTGADGYYDVWAADSNGANLVDLTSPLALPTKHIGNPCWHPSNQWIVFQVQKAGTNDLKGSPGVGGNNNLYAAPYPNPSNLVYALTDIAQGLGQLHPVFNPRGTKLLWSFMRTAPGGANLLTYDWELRIADWAVTAGVPALSNIVSYRPGGTALYESHDWWPDESRALYSYQLETDTSGPDIAYMNIATQQQTKLTVTATEWEEHSHLSPTGRTIAFMASKDAGGNPAVATELKTELWTMAPDGTTPTRRTFHSAAGHDEYRSGLRAVVGDMAWNPRNSKQLAYRLLLPGGGDADEIIIATFKDAQ